MTPEWATATDPKLHVSIVAQDRQMDPKAIFIYFKLYFESIFSWLEPARPFILES